MLIVAFVYWGKVTHNLMRFRNVKNLKYKMQKQPSIGFLKKRYYGFFLFFKKKKKKSPEKQKLKIGQSHRKNIKLPNSKI